MTPKVSAPPIVLSCWDHIPQILWAGPHNSFSPMGSSRHDVSVTSWLGELRAGRGLALMDGPILAWRGPAGKEAQINSQDRMTGAERTRRPREDSPGKDSECETRGQSFVVGEWAWLTED